MDAKQRAELVKLQRRRDELAAELAALRAERQRLLDTDGPVRR